MPNNNNNMYMFCCRHLERSVYVTCRTFVGVKTKPHGVTSIIPVETGVRTLTHLAKCLPWEEGNPVFIVGPAMHRLPQETVRQCAAHPTCGHKKYFVRRHFDSKLLTSVSLSNKWGKKQSVVVCNLRWMNSSISCYRSGRTTCRQVWRVALFRVTEEIAMPLIGYIPLLPHKKLSVVGQLMGNNDVTATIVCGIYLFAEQQRYKHVFVGRMCYGFTSWLAGWL